MDISKEREIMYEYQKKRDLNQELLEQREKEVYEKYPDIKKETDNIKRIGLDMAKSVLSENPEMSLDQLEDILNSHIANKKRLMKRYGIPEDYLELQYVCKNCKDTGFNDDGTQCNCLKQQILNEMYKMSNLDQLLEKENFLNFDETLFSDEIIPGDDISPRENILHIKSEVLNTLKHFDDKDSRERNNLFLYGPTGCGKTYICSCIAKYVLDIGHTVIYKTGFELMDAIERFKFKTESYSIEDEKNYQNLFNVDLLIIDDLGTETRNMFSSSEIFNIINSRIRSGKKTIISTNLTPKMIGVSYSDRILSRIIGHYKLLKFIGNDIRVPRLNKR